MPPEPLALLLLRASRWFDRQLLDRLEEGAWPRLSAAQSLVFAHLSPDGVPPATLARRLGTTRQAAQDLVGGLVRHGLLEIVPDPDRKGGRLVVLTGTGRLLAQDARGILRDLEIAFGAERAHALRALLTDFGREETAGTTPVRGTSA